MCVVVCCACVLRWLCVCDVCCGVCGVVVFLCLYMWCCLLCVHVVCVWCVGVVWCVVCSFLSCFLFSLFSFSFLFCFFFFFFSFSFFLFPFLLLLLLLALLSSLLTTKQCVKNRSDQPTNFEAFECDLVHGSCTALSSQFTASANELH